MIFRNHRELRGNEQVTRRFPLERTAVVAAAFVLLLSGAALCGDRARPDCPIDEGPCTRDIGSLQVTFDLLPKPVRTMRELNFSVTMRDNGRPVKDATVSVSLTMPGMTMGTNTVLLPHQAEGRYEGKGVVVRCPSGKKVWKATVDVRRGRTLSVPFIFEVH